MPQKRLIMNYLGPVYKTGRRLRLNSNREARDEFRALVPGLRKAARKNRFRVIIELTADKRTTQKSRNTYALALQAASDAGVPSISIAQFIDDNGGIKKLAERQQRKQSQRRKSKANCTSRRR